MYRFFVKGVVQGVGFRPYIYNAAIRKGLRGYVKNTGNGVEIVVNEEEAMREILEQAPPLARIDSVRITEDTEKEQNSFRIEKSEGRGYAEVPPDLFLCEECLRELRDPEDRRYGYFFITCTNCGPRFTITKESPYDRHTTSMVPFEMCETCKQEYTDPENRRYHAQTIACHDCGPKIRLLNGEEEIGGIKEAIALLKQGEILAIKGVGGFHLACRMSSVQQLRALTKREHKPYALMCIDCKEVEKLASVTPKEREMLTSVERPIVLVTKKEKESHKDISELETLGIMLPYTGLHYLLLDQLGEPLIMTSANLSDEPITTRGEEQLVPFVLEHDRDIINPVDDSVVKVIDEEPLLLRRSRGFAPRSIPFDSKSEILALGAEMNSVFCIVKEGKAILSPYLGNTANEASFTRYKTVLEHFLKLTGSKPEVVVVDQHPGYNTSRYGKELAHRFGARLVKVQHHHAHAMAIATEHQLTAFVAITMDGLGYGEQGTIWGGEIFSVRDGAFERIGHLEEQPQLGGDSATRFPKKMLFGILSKILGEKELLAKRLFSEKEGKLYLQMLKEEYNTPSTTSAGRVLDAVAALLGLCDERTYEGRPAMLLESVATRPLKLEPVIEEKEGMSRLLTTPLFSFLIEHEGEELGVLAATALEYLAIGMHQIAATSAGKRAILFSGGVAYNKIISSYMKRAGVLLHTALPPGDGGICFGQAAIAR